MRRPLTLRRMAVLTPVLVLAVFVGVAIAKTFTLNIAKNGTVMDQAMVTTHKAIVVNSKGFAVYFLTGDSKKNPECTKANSCWDFWPPVKVKKGQTPTKALGIKGKLTVWHHSGIFQVLLAGHPLYTFSNDTSARVATGEGLQTFGGTWHVVTPKRFKPGAAGSPAPAPNPNPNPYPPPPGW
jgi:predicted lipoprotein with Yx(FWY)xxD motif